MGDSRRAGGGSITGMKQVHIHIWKHTHGLLLSEKHVTEQSNDPTYTKNVPYLHMQRKIVGTIYIQPLTVITHLRNRVRRHMGELSSFISMYFWFEQ